MPDRLSFFYRLKPVRLFCRVGGALAIVSVGCSTLPEPKFQRFSFPKNAYVGDVQRPYTVLGPVRAKVDYQTLDPNREEKDLCRNYYNKAVRELIKYAKKQGADAVVDVKSVVFLVDGRTETYSTPECSDEGGDGQVLAQGVAVKWKGGAAENGAWTQPPSVPAAAGASASSTAAQAAPTPPQPSRALSNAPMMPPGGQLVPEQDEPAPPVSASGTASADADNKPVTAHLEDYDPSKDSVSPSKPAAASAPASNLAPRPVFTPATEPPRAPAATSRLPFADPRAVPGSFQRAFP